MTLLLSEDKALRERISGITVTDQKASGAETERTVGVWFGQPDQEIRDQSFPYITIDMIDFDRDIAREHRGRGVIPYIDTPTTVGTGNAAVPYDPDVHSVETDLPIPMYIDYQISTFARHPRHDRQILSALLSTKLPIRFGVLEVDDNTVRRLDVLGVSKRDLPEQGKRLFMNAITVRVSSEIFTSQIRTLYKVLEARVTGPQDPAYSNFTDVGDITITS